jgi:hypothetical protein
MIIAISRLNLVQTVKKHLSIIFHEVVHRKLIILIQTYLSTIF